MMEAGHIRTAPTGEFVVMTDEEKDQFKQIAASPVKK